MKIDGSLRHWGVIALLVLVAACAPVPPTLRPVLQPSETPDLPTPLRVTAAPTLAPRSTSDLPPPIVFESNRSGRYEIYAINSAGRDLLRLTDSDSSSSEGSGSPDWSPDGSRIAYSSKVNGDWDIFVLAGGVETNLTQTLGEDDKADWSPDGTRIVFTSLRGNLRWADVFVMDADGSHVRDLSPYSDDDREPVWSPNGQEIAYRSFHDGNYDLYIMDIESGVPRYLTKTDPPVWNMSPAWSPDGAQIAFETNRDGNWEIYVTDNNGANVRNLTHNSADDKEPAWSPDGTQLVFTSDRDGNFELYRMDVVSGAVTRLTYDCGRDHNADWRRGASGDSGGEQVPTAVAYVVRSVNLRAGPGLGFDQVGGADVGDCLTVVGRSSDDQWLQVRTPDGRAGWAARLLVDIQGDLAVVPVSA